MKIDDKLRSIKPYVLTMRFQDNLSIVDVKLKDNWKVPPSEVFGIKAYGREYPNTYMFYSDNEELGIHDILEFVEEIVRVNIEREKKLALLTQKIEELKSFFMGHTLEELQTLSFEIDTVPLNDEFVPTRLDTINMVDEEGMVEKPMPDVSQMKISEEEIMEEEMVKEESN